MTLRHSLFLTFLFTLLSFSGCATADPNTQSRSAMLTEINAEPQGDYFIARRYYKVDYKFWGYIRKPGESWAAARMVMLNEQDTDAVVADLADKRRQCLLFAKAKPGRRLVEQQKHGVERKCARYLQNSLLAQRQSSSQLIDLAAEAEPIELNARVV